MRRVMHRSRDTEVEAQKWRHRQSAATSATIQVKESDKSRRDGNPWMSPAYSNFPIVLRSRSWLGHKYLRTCNILRFASAISFSVLNNLQQNILPRWWCVHGFIRRFTNAAMEPAKWLQERMIIVKKKTHEVCKKAYENNTKYSKVKAASMV